MKKLKSIVLGAALLGNTAYGACVYSNTVDLPAFHINADNTRKAYVWLSNNSDSGVSVSMKLYNNTGTDVTNTVQVGAGPVTIAPKAAWGIAILGNGLTSAMRGELTWTSNDCLTKPMNASLETQWNGSLMVQNVNSGKGF